ncbi:MAG: hypothetical protein JXA22_05310 [Candidatus Thermoplasmatota archaeon]|nr:hypothetical protein [Candidatus Thermoplasmatota archaeon]
MASEPDSYHRGPLLIIIGAGILYLVFSLFHLIRTFAGKLYLLRMLNVPADIITAGILLLTGYLLVAGGVKLWRGKKEGTAFAWVGSITGALLSSMSLLVLLSNAFSSLVLTSDDLEGWTPAEDLTPGLYLGILVVLILPVLGYWHLPPKDHVKEGGVL